jgi:hypothetical protein
MGKVFVKSPVESPNDLLAKQTAVAAPSRSQRLRRAIGDEFRDFGRRAGPAVGEYLATRDVAGGGRELARSVGKFANNEIQNFGQLMAAGINPIVALLGRAPQTPEEEERARMMVREMVAQQRQEELAPEKEEAALRQFDTMGMKATDVKNLYPFMSAEEALRQERMARGTVARRERVAALRDEPATTQAQEKEEKQTIVDTSDAVRRDPVVDKKIKNFRENRLFDEFMARQGGYPEGMLDEEEEPNQTPTGLGGTDIPVPPSINQLKENMGEIPDLTSDQGVVGQERQHAELEKVAANMDHEPESTNLALEEQKNIPSLNNATPLKAPPPLLQPPTPALLNLPPENAGPFSLPPPSKGMKEEDYNWGRPPVL